MIIHLVPNHIAQRPSNAKSQRFNFPCVTNQHGNLDRAKAVRAELDQHLCSTRSYDQSSIIQFIVQFSPNDCIVESVAQPRNTEPV